MIHICLLIILHSASCYIQPLVSGTLQFTSLDLLASSTLNKSALLGFDRTFSDLHKDIGMATVIGALKVDDDLRFYFQSEMECKGTCQIIVTMHVLSQSVRTSANYFINVDYFVAHGLKTAKINVTDYQWHFNKGTITSYDQQNRLQDNSIPMQNHDDADLLLLFPNGFNKISLTGHIVDSFVFETDMYVIHYMKTMTGPFHETMGWDRKNDFVYYQAVLIRQNYLGEACTVQTLYRLFEEKQYSCDLQGVQFFAGFIGTQSQSFEGKMVNIHRGLRINPIPLKQQNSFGAIIVPYIGNNQLTSSFLREHLNRFELNLLSITMASLLVIGVLGFIVWVCRLKVFKKQFVLYEERDLSSTVEQTEAQRSEGKTNRSEEQIPSQKGKNLTEDENLVANDFKQIGDIQAEQLPPFVESSQNAIIE